MRGLAGLSSLVNGFTAEDLAPFLSSVGLIAGRVASMGLGFLAWLVAARLFAPADVGLASGVVAAMMLCVQVALIGVGSAVIALLPAHREQPASLLNAAFTGVAVMSVLAAVGFLVLARAAFHELDAILGTPALAVSFVAMSLFGAINVLYDNISIAMRRGDQVLTRNVVFGLITIGLPPALAYLTEGRAVWIILAAWALAGLAACSLGVVQTRRVFASYLPRPSFHRPLASQLVRVGLPNWALTMTERGPALAMPILVTELISPTTNAFWYAAWMMAWVVMIIPISAGQTLFAEVARAPQRAAPATRHALYTSLAIGVPAALAMAIFASLALSLLGNRYANEADGALRILVITVVPFSFLQAYYAVCRARGQLTEAIAAGTISGVAAVFAAIMAGQAGGLAPMAAAWVGVQSMAGLWAGIRLWLLTRTPAERRAPASHTPNAM